MKLPVTVPWNPVLSRMPVSGQLYAISGGTWIPVPDGTTRADLPKYMTWDRPTVASDAPQMERWTVEGSKGNSYRVEAFNGLWRCSCKGYEFRRKCRHIEEVKTSCGM
jgi:hypothetical protein